MGSHELNNHHRAIQRAQGIDPDTPEATRARDIAMFGAQETTGLDLTAIRNRSNKQGDQT